MQCTLRLLFPILMALSTTQPATLPQVPGKEPTLPGQFASTKLGLFFGYPAEFVTAQWAPQIADSNSPFSASVVLVESRNVDVRDLTSLTPGKAPTITIARLSKVQTKYIRGLVQEKWKSRIGDHVVYKLPGFPGPSGENLHCYLLVDESDRDMLAVADRSVGGARREQQDTHYDWVIERIIATCILQEPKTD